MTLVDGRGGTAWVLEYHNVDPAPATPWYVTPTQLRNHLQFLRERGYRLGDLHDLLAGEEVVVLTFDDAYVNVVEHALPILAALGATATVFVPVNQVGGTNTHDWFSGGLRKVERIMSWAQLRLLQEAGWSIQSHGCSHVPAEQLLGDHVEDELARSKRTIEAQLDAEVFAYAFPYGILPDPARVGDLDDRLRANGYRLAFLSDGGETASPPPEPYRVRRIPIVSAHELPPVPTAPEPG
jgi:peptidoglycan/xylan/chitin deacetylase (PgdA/CDA1 family)